MNSSSLPLVPKPNALTELGGTARFELPFELRAADTPENGWDLKPLASLYPEWLKAAAPDASGKGSLIRLCRRENAAGPEAFHLKIGSDEIVVSANGMAGVRHAVQTLLQLFPISETPGGSVELPLLEIDDAPRFGWRGLMLDCSRHFMPVAFIKKLLKWLALYKLNVFHWHLVDDQGWRLEIKRFPKLTEIGGRRKSTLIGHLSTPEPERVYDGIEHGGFYTQEEVQEIVAYAADLGIEVVPEIEMPGHSMAALAAYPELSCRGERLPVPGEWGIKEEVYCAGNDETIALLEGVLEEVLSLFPGRYIHVGGDECPKARWHECPKCQQRIKENGLKDEEELQSWFIRHFAAFLKARGRDLIGWDEILEGGLAPGAAVMSWRGDAGAVHAAQAGHHAVMAMTAYTYLDKCETSDPEEPVGIGGVLPWQQVYGYEPLPASLGADEAPFILGVQGQLWTEYVRDAKEAEYRLFPRLAALAEVAWTQPGNKDEASFRERLAPRMEHLKNQGVTVHPMY